MKLESDKATDVLKLHREKGRGHNNRSRREKKKGSII